MTTTKNMTIYRFGVELRLDESGGRNAAEQRTRKNIGWDEASS